MRFKDCFISIFLPLIFYISILPDRALAESEWLMHGFNAESSFWNREEKSLFPPLKESWRYRPMGTQAALESVIVASGIALLSSMADGDKNVVFAVNAHSGEHQWKFTLPGGGSSAMGAVPAVYQDPIEPLVLFGGQGDDNLYAVNLRDGQERWRVSGMRSMYSSDLKIVGETLYLNNNQTSSLMGINMNNGRKIWEAPDVGLQSDIIIEDGVLVQGGVYGPPLIGVGTLQGNKIWETHGSTRFYMAAWNGLVFVAYTGDSPTKLDDYPYYKYDRIAAFRVRDGQKAWETPLNDDLTYGCLAVADNMLYVASIKNENSSAKGILYAVNPRTGDIIRQRNEDLSISRMVIANNIIYAGGWNTTTLYALDAKSLETVWETNLGTGCSDLAVANGRLYVVLGWSGLVVYENQESIAGNNSSRGGIFGTPQDPQKSGSVKAYSDKYAIVIGISDYKDLKSSAEETIPGKIVDLKYAEKDAIDIANFLRNDPKSGGNWEIHELIGSSASEDTVKSTIGSVLNEAGSDDLVYLFFAGHARRSPSDASEVYLLTYDFEYEKEYSGVEYDWVKTKILKSSARNIIAFIDACRSGTVGFARGSQNPDQEMLGEIQGLRGFKAIFTSGTSSQVAYEDDNLKNGIFTHFLLKGFRGEAPNIDNDNFVDLKELEEYVTEKVEKYTHSNPKMSLQKPRLWGHDGLISDNFPVAMR